MFKKKIETSEYLVIRPNLRKGVPIVVFVLIAIIGLLVYKLFDRGISVIDINFLYLSAGFLAIPCVLIIIAQFIATIVINKDTISVGLIPFKKSVLLRDVVSARRKIEEVDTPDVSYNNKIIELQTEKTKLKLGERSYTEADLQTLIAYIIERMPRAVIDPGMKDILQNRREDAFL